jgi:hypothetical protein
LTPFGLSAVLKIESEPCSAFAVYEGLDKMRLLLKVGWPKAQVFAVVEPSCTLADLKKIIVRKLHLHPENIEHYEFRHVKHLHAPRRFGHEEGSDHTTLAELGIEDRSVLFLSSTLR